MGGALCRNYELEIGLVGLDKAGLVGCLVVVDNGEQHFQLHRGYVVYCRHIHYSK